MDVSRWYLDHSRRLVEADIDRRFYLGRFHLGQWDLYHRFDWDVPRRQRNSDVGRHAFRRRWLRLGLRREPL
ncbi:MAG TPA: hypothetical protein VKB30_09085, partial [Candidatus Limnocylindrales bacterium]|nr:hypothetical protein [Candidatus Limnocylindrales bacterium]